MQRNAHGREVCSLDGTWRIAFDPLNEGKVREWHRLSALRGKKSSEILVPSIWELMRPGYDGVAWYWRQFDAPKRWQGRVLWLKFWAVNYFAEVWVNGKPVGNHEGGYTPFELDVTHAVKRGALNTVVVRVVDPPKRGQARAAGFVGVRVDEGAGAMPTEGIDGFILDEVPGWKEQFYYNFGGIWQSVQLIAADPVHVRDCFVEPLVARAEVKTHIELRNLGKPGSRRVLKISIRPKGDEGTALSQTEEDLALPQGVHALVRTLEFPRPRMWTPDTPFLYRLIVEVAGGNGTGDELGVTFGMRELTFTHEGFFLNGERILLKSALHQGVYARTIAYPETAEVARREIMLAKQAGLNMLRMHIKPPAPIFADLADELGLMLHEEPPIGWMRDNPKLKERELREVRELVLRDRNHPSVVMWGLLNETSNLGGSQVAGSVAIMHELALEARAYDPTRIIIDDSGGYGNSSNAYPPGSVEPVWMRDMHRYNPAPVSDFDYACFETLGQPDQLSFMSEFGVGGLEDLDLVLRGFDPAGDKDLEDYVQLKGFRDALEKGMREHGLEKLFGDLSGLCEAAQRMQAAGDALFIDALRANPRMHGYCLTQFCDASMELGAGVLDVCRNPKKVFETLREVHAPLRLIVYCHPRSIAAGGDLSFRVTLANDTAFTGPAELELEITGPGNRTVFTERKRVEVKRWVNRLYAASPRIAGPEGSYLVSAVLRTGSTVLARNQMNALMIDPARPSPPTTPVMLLDPENSIREWLAAKNVPFSTFSPSATGRRIALVSGVKDPAGYYRIYDQLRELGQMIREGAIAVFLEGNFNELMYLFLRFNIGQQSGVGGFVGNFHYVKPHPVFDGLPSGCLMDWEYTDVWAKETMKESTIGNLAPETIVGCFSAPVEGIGSWGSDLFITRQGRGRVLMSKLRLSENVGKNPVADRIVMNMLRWAEGSAGQSVAAGSAAAEEAAGKRRDD